MNNKEDKQKQEQLATQQAADRALFLQSFSKAQEQSPLQKRLEEGNMDWLDWEQGKGSFAGTPTDVMSAPGLGPSLSIYNRAKAGQQGERQGIGALRMGLNASDPGMAANLAEQSKLRREQDASGALENAVAMKSAEVKGSSLPLINLDQQRTMGLAGMAGNQSGQSTGLWSQFRRRPGMLGQFGDAFATNLGGSLGRGIGGGASGMMFP